MKPKEMKPAEVFRLLDRKEGGFVGSYSRAYCDEYDFNTLDEARGANCHGVFRDKVKFKVNRYRVTYELIEEDVDPPTEEEIETSAAREREDADIKVEMEKLGDLGVIGNIAAYMRIKHRRECLREYLSLSEVETKNHTP
jgi:hypothetical protein